MRESKVSITNEFNEKLVGLESISEEEKDKYSTVVLVHGFGVTKEEYGMFDELAEKLTDEGFLVYRFDFSGLGESEGDYSETSLTKQKSDLSKIIEFVKSQEKVDSSKIGILAQSLGTAVTVALTPKVKSLILMGSVAHTEIISDKRIKWDILNKKGTSKIIKSSGRVITIKPQFWSDMESYDLLKSISKFKGSTLFIHGSLDDKVPISEMEAYYEKANEPKEKIILKGANHGLIPYRDSMYQIATAWFKKHL